MRTLSPGGPEERPDTLEKAYVLIRRDSQGSALPVWIGLPHPGLKPWAAMMVAAPPLYGM